MYQAVILVKIQSYTLDEHGMCNPSNQIHSGSNVLTLNAESEAELKQKIEDLLHRMKDGKKTQDN